MCKYLYLIIFYLILSCSTENLLIVDETINSSSGNQGNKEYKLNSIDIYSLDKDNKTLDIKLNISSNIDLLINYDMYILKNQSNTSYQDNYTEEELYKLNFEKIYIDSNKLWISSDTYEKDFILKYKNIINNIEGTYYYYIKDSNDLKYIHVYTLNVETTDNDTLNSIKVIYNKDYNINYEGKWSYKDNKSPDFFIISRDISIEPPNINAGKYFILNNELIINNNLKFPAQLYLDNDTLYTKIRYNDIKKFYPNIDTDGICISSIDVIKSAYIPYKVCINSYNKLCSKDMGYNIYNELYKFNDIVNTIAVNEFGSNTCQ